MNEDGAKSAAVEAIKPNECEPPDLCPCSPFLRCNSRLPYGSSVWADPEKRKQAMGVIAYNGKTGAVKDAASLDKMAEKFQKAIQRNVKEGKNYNEFYKNLYPLVYCGKNVRVLTLPEISDAYMTAQMRIVKSSALCNTGNFTNFQRSIFVRGNLVKNHLVMKQDPYKEKGKSKYRSKKIIPFSGLYTGKLRDKQWSVDHIQTKSKGGCNRFCNGALLSFKDNGDKLDSWPGCPCLDCKKKAGEQKKFTRPPAAKKDYNLWECQYLCKANQEPRGRKLPPHPPATIEKYKRICDLDDPRHFQNRLKKNVAKEIDNIRQ